MESADKLCDTMMQAIFDDGEYKEGDEVCVYINAFGSTSVTEMAIAYRRVRQILGEKGIRVHDSDINNYFRTQEMGGFSISLLTLDDELKQYYDMPCYCPYYAKGAVSAPAEDDTAVPGSPAAALLSMDTGDNAFAPFAAAGRAMLLSMGGASGVIFGSMFLAGDSFAPKSVLTGSDLGLLEAKALETVKERGGAARFGKAKSLGERAIGFPDAGAASVALIFEAMREYAEGLQ